MEGPASGGLMHAAPLLEEERDFFVAAGSQYLLNPFLAHWPGSVPALSPYDDPINTRELELSKILEQRFNR